MNPRLSELQQAYKDRGGAAYLGDEAWTHLEEQAGEVMSKFIEKYVRRPIQDIGRFEQALSANGSKRQIQLLDLEAKLEGEQIMLRLGDHVRHIQRREDPNLTDEENGNSTDDS